jgi:pantoate--beta-alanine ligase
MPCHNRTCDAIFPQGPTHMERIESVHQMQSLMVNLRAHGRRIALIPTQGALHPGHVSLIKAARAHGDTVVVSIFVNPVQFGANEGFDKYPRDLEKDTALCSEAGVDVLFVPPLAEMYPKGYSTYVTEESFSRGLCGVSRPGHFRGVTTVMAKLFNIVRPDVLVLGRKNAQQAAVTQKTIEDLNFSVRVVVQPTVREPDGLPWGSRNSLLSTGQRNEATVILRALTTGKGLVDAGVRNVDRVIAETTHVLSTKRRVRVIYVAIVDPDTMEPERQIAPGRSMLAVAVWIDEVRLIDNIVL